MNTISRAAILLQPPEKGGGGGQEYCCCMCGDFGLSSELFRCKVCHFRSQHRYCSNEYPKAEDYSVCNWCLISEIKDKTLKKYSINSSLSNRTNSISRSGDDQEDRTKTVIKKKNKLHDIKIMKKQRIRSPPRPPERLPPAVLVAEAARKRVTITTRRGHDHQDMDDHLEQKLMIKKPVFRSKVRRYKFLDEVSCL